MQLQQLEYPQAQPKELQPQDHHPTASARVLDQNQALFQIPLQVQGHTRERICLEEK
jgi:hypothetical protein